MTQIIGSNASLLTTGYLVTSTLVTSTFYSTFRVKISQLTQRSQSILDVTTTNANQGACTRILAVSTVPNQPRLRIVLDNQTGLRQGCPFRVTSRIITLGQWHTVVLHVRVTQGVAYIDSVA